MFKIVKAQGGLGNQLFQFAFALELAQKTKHRIILDTSWYRGNHGDTARIFQLDKIFQDVDKINWLPNNLKTLGNLFPRKLFVNEDPHNLDQATSGLFFNGYFQRAYSHIDLSNKLKQDHYCNFAKPTKDRIAMHIRRGDYLKPKSIQHHGLCTLGYFLLAHEKLREIIGDLEVDIFSDDERLKIFAESQGWNYVKAEREPIQDIANMSLYRGLVISNSTFSWWSTRFAKEYNREQIVVAPTPWLNTYSKLDELLVDKNWILLDKNTQNGIS